MSGIFPRGPRNCRTWSGVAFRPVKTDITCSQFNSRKFDLKLKLMQMCQEKLEGVIVVGGASTKSQVIGQVYGRASRRGKGRPRIRHKNAARKCESWGTAV
jgi:hypothetical protein